jgi:hypothetical protein
VLKNSVLENSGLENSVLENSGLEKLVRQSRLEILLAETFLAEGLRLEVQDFDFTFPYPSPPRTLRVRPEEVQPE